MNRIKIERGHSITGRPFGWDGRCTCGKTWMFHFWGASLGYGMEHLWRHGVAS